MAAQGLIPTLVVVVVVVILSTLVRPVRGECDPSTAVVAVASVLSTLGAVAIVLLVAYFVLRWRRRRAHNLAQDRTGRGRDKGILNNAFVDNDEFIMAEEGASPSTRKEQAKTRKPVSPLRRTSNDSKTWSSLPRIDKSGRLYREGSCGSLDENKTYQDPDIISVTLESQDIIGLGFNISGSYSDGIRVSEVHNRGPAKEGGQIKVGDRILSVTVSYENIVYEDALTILSYGSPYPVKIVLEKAIDGNRKKFVDKKQKGISTRRLTHPLYRSRSEDTFKSSASNDHSFTNSKRAHSELKLDIGKRFLKWRNKYSKKDPEFSNSYDSNIVTVDRGMNSKPADQVMYNSRNEWHPSDAKRAKAESGAHSKPADKIMLKSRNDWPNTDANIVIVDEGMSSKQIEQVISKSRNNDWPTTSGATDIATVDTALNSKLAAQAMSKSGNDWITSYANLKSIDMDREVYSKPTDQILERAHLSKQENFYTGDTAASRLDKGSPAGLTDTGIMSSDFMNQYLLQKTPPGKPERKNRRKSDLQTMATDHCDLNDIIVPSNTALTLSMPGAVKSDLGTEVVEELIMPNKIKGNSNDDAEIERENIFNNNEKDIGIAAEFLIKTIDYNEPRRSPSPEGEPIQEEMIVPHDRSERLLLTSPQVGEELMVCDHVMGRKIIENENKSDSKEKDISEALKCIRETEFIFPDPRRSPSPEGEPVEEEIIVPHDRSERLLHSLPPVEEELIVPDHVIGRKIIENENKSDIKEKDISEALNLLRETEFIDFVKPRRLPSPEGEPVEEDIIVPNDRSERLLYSLPPVEEELIVPDHVIGRKIIESENKSDSKEKNISEALNLLRETEFIDFVKPGLSPSPEGEPVEEEIIVPHDRSERLLLTSPPPHR